MLKANGVGSGRTFVGIGYNNAAQLQFAILLDDLRGVRPQDRIGEIANHALDDAPIRPPKLADNRTWS